jgi:hypothetical protein
MLNKFLLERGFGPAILPVDPEVFGGGYDLEELVGFIRGGLARFEKNVGKA